MKSLKEQLKKLMKSKIIHKKLFFMRHGKKLDAGIKVKKRYLNERLKKMYYYDEGGIQGFYLGWHRNGMRKSLRTYFNGSLVDISYEWCKNGRLKKIRNHKSQ